ncbi:TPA: acyltransferase [Klebsiella pneumoniae]|uniref:acyltransferase family protein n=1 Tax=Klebsiella TaxID=570 RepID=UPI0022B2FD7C|nr:MULTISPECIES: acyltransferase [Klebsiella]EKV8606975.1 acyltransferase [Klebsiella pneumoniae]MEC5327576.1 acyltransferase [Klebsiella oxytoca]MEC5358716.1 acyltransferase [Klebsiella oxytoca]MEE2192831.1 acyltransferase [Klebsiella pneumoniae]HBY6636878.1 acyltransferase [Klebsiella pneumoniae]
MNSRNYSIQALRAVAALFVVVDHTLTQFNLYNHNAGYAGKILSNLENLGLIGVYIFFIISGYIMSMTTNNKPSGFNSAAIFIKKRLIRIYPTYWIWLSIMVVLWLLGLALRSHHYSLDKIISSYLLIPFTDTDSTNFNPILSQGWTLIYEMLFYCIFAVLLLFKLTENRMIILTLSAFIVLKHLGHNDLLSNDFSRFLDNWVLFLFPLGMLIFRLEGRLRALLCHSVVRNTMHLITISLFFFVIFRDSNYNKEVNNTLTAIFIFISLFIVKIDSKPLSVLGDASYSIYLTHTFIVMTYGVVSKGHYLDRWVLLLLSIPVMIASVLFGVAAYYIVEQKIQKLTSNIFFNKRITHSISS